MSIQRYHVDWINGCHVAAEDGDCVTYADHIAAMLTADRQFMEMRTPGRIAETVAAEREAMRAACIAAVEALLHWVESNDRVNYIAIDRDDVIAALREVQP